MTMPALNLNHVALVCSDRERAHIFYTRILNMALARSFTIDPELAEKIFGISKPIDVDDYQNERFKFEVFIIDEPHRGKYEHVCIEVPDKHALIERCRANGLEPRVIEDSPRNRELLFIEDYSGNVFEVKEVPHSPGA